MFHMYLVPLSGKVETSVLSGASLDGFSVLFLFSFSPDLNSFDRLADKCQVLAFDQTSKMTRRTDARTGQIPGRTNARTEKCQASAGGRQMPRRTDARS